MIDIEDSGDGGIGSLGGSSSLLLPASGSTERIELLQSVLGKPVPRAYGRHVVGGNVIFQQDNGDGTTTYFIALGEGEWDALETLWVAGVSQTLPDTTHIHFHPGLDGTLGIETDPSTANQKICSFYPGPFLPALTFSRIAYLGLCLPYDPNSPDLVLDIRGVYRTRKVRIFDSSGTQTSYEYSANPAWCTLDWLIDRMIKPHGLINEALTTAEKAQIDFSAFATEAAYCAADPGDGKARFESHVAITDQTDLLRALDQMLLTCRGYLIEHSGKIALYCDKARSSSFTANRINIAADSMTFPCKDVRALANQLNVKYRHLESGTVGGVAHPENDFQSVKLPVEDYDHQDRVKKIIPAEIDLGNSLPGRARRLGKYVLERSIQCAEQIKLAILQAGDGNNPIDLLPGDLITAPSDVDGWATDDYEVLEITDEPDGSRAVFGQEYKSTIFHDSLASQDVIFPTNPGTPSPGIPTDSGIPDTPVINVVKQGRYSVTIGIEKPQPTVTSSFPYVEVQPLGWNNVTALIIQVATDSTFLDIVDVQKHTGLALTKWQFSFSTEKAGHFYIRGYATNGVGDSAFADTVAFDTDQSEGDTDVPSAPTAAAQNTADSTTVNYRHIRVRVDYGSCSNIRSLWQIVVQLHTAAAMTDPEDAPLYTPSDPIYLNQGSDIAWDPAASFPIDGSLSNKWLMLSLRSPFDADHVMLAYVTSVIDATHLQLSDKWLGLTNGYPYLVTNTQEDVDSGVGYYKGQTTYDPNVRRADEFEFSVPAGTNYYARAWLFNRLGRSVASAASGAKQSQKMSGTDLDNTSLISQVFTVSAGTFTDNSPTAGKIAWSGVKVQYRGVEYSITNDNTVNQWVYWQLASPTVFATSNAALPTLGANDFAVAMNVSGAAISQWAPGKEVSANRINVGTLTGILLQTVTMIASTIKTASSGQRIEFDATDGLRGFDSSGNVLTQLTTGGVLTLKTAASGNRLELDATNGLRGIGNYFGAEATCVQIKPDGSMLARSIFSSNYYGVSTRNRLGLGDAIGATSGSFSFTTDGSYVGFYVMLDDSSTTLLSSYLLSTADLNLRTTGASSEIRLMVNGTERMKAISTGIDVTGTIQVDGTQVLGAQGAAVADATGSGDVVDRLNDLLARCRAHGFIDT